MADYKFPKDGTMDGSQPLTADDEIFIPREFIEDGDICCFEILIEEATALDAGVTFKFFGGLDESVLSASNITESGTGVTLTGTGKLVFREQFTDNVDTAFKIVIAGTNAGSTATFIIRGRTQ